MTNTILVKVVKGTCGLGYGYLAGSEYQLPEKLAIKFINQGIALAVSDEVTVSENELPADFPALEILQENNLDTAEKIKVFKDLTRLKGIGAKTAEQILEALK
tara:strand:- start:1022 stop:1330 length:309 start_codon:yes stop_codon:yes gene_type:complete